MESKSLMFEQNEQKAFIDRKELKFIIFTSILTSDMMTKRVGNGIPTH